MKRKEFDVNKSLLKRVKNDISPKKTEFMHKYIVKESRGLKKVAYLSFNTLAVVMYLYNKGTCIKIT